MHISAFREAVNLYWIKMRRKYLIPLLHWLPAMIGIAIIMTESTDALSSSHTSRWLLPIWVKLFGPVTAMRWERIHHLLRKIGHFAGYGAVSLGFFHSWWWSLRQWTAKSRKSLLQYATALALVSTLLLASADEWHQSFIPSRTSSPVDVGIDLCGGIAAHLVLFGLLMLTARLRVPKMRS